MKIVRVILKSKVLSAALACLFITLVMQFIGLSYYSSLIATVFSVIFVLWTIVGMAKDIFSGQYGIDILAVIAIISTLVVGEPIASLIVVLMLTGGEVLEDFASHRADRELRSLLDNAPTTAHLVLTSDSSEQIHDIRSDDVRVGDTLLVRPAEVVPVDGKLLAHIGVFDQSSLTGESLPVTKHAGDEVLSGSINGAQAARIQAVRTSADSQYQQIVKLVHEAKNVPAPTVRLADRFALPFTIISLIIAGVAWALSGSSERFAQVLVLATPCPLLLAAPVAFLGGLSRAAKSGIIVKGGIVLEKVAKIRSAAFDKTGTLTRGRPFVCALHPQGITEDELLCLAASVEQYSGHVLAEGIRQAAKDKNLSLLPINEASEISSIGITAHIDNNVVTVGKPEYISSITDTQYVQSNTRGETSISVAVNSRFVGNIELADKIRPESADVISWLKKHGVDRIAMLTGDTEKAALPTAYSLGITDVHANLLPADKVQAVQDLQPRPVLMVGDGVNDAPVLAAADVGIAMGAHGATAAGEAANAIILVDSLEKITEIVQIGKRTMKIAATSIWLGVGLSILFMLVAANGVIPTVAGALIQEGIDLAAILYALRALVTPGNHPFARKNKDRIYALNADDGYRPLTRHGFSNGRAQNAMC